MKVARATGLEPATSGVTGGRVAERNQGFVRPPSARTALRAWARV